MPESKPGIFAKYNTYSATEIHGGGSSGKKASEWKSLIGIEHQGLSKSNPKSRFRGFHPYLTFQSHPTLSLVEAAPQPASEQEAGRVTIVIATRSSLRTF
jgi:hypothetical protein